MEKKTPNPISAIAVPVGADARPRPAHQIALACGHLSRNLSRRLPYYLTSEEVHRVISAAKNSRDHLFLRLLWETGTRVSEAIVVRLADVSRDGIRVLG